MTHSPLKHCRPRTRIFRSPSQGPITLSSLFPLKDALGALTSHLTILDFSQVPYVDSAGLGTILMFYVSAEKNGRKLALAGVSDRVLSLIRMTRVDPCSACFPMWKRQSRALRRNRLYPGTV